MGERILVVEDEPSIAEVVSLYLKRAGYDVHSAERTTGAGRGLRFIPP